MWHYLFYGMAAFYIVSMVWLGWEFYHAPIYQNSWFDYVEQAEMRETKADMQRRFTVHRVLGAQAAFVDFGAHDNGDGTTSWYAQDQNGVRYSHRTNTEQK